MSSPSRSATCGASTSDAGPISFSTIGRGDRLLRIERGETADEVLQLADIAGPAVALHGLDRARLDRLRRQAFALGAGEEMPHQIGDVVAPLAQRRQADRHDIQPEEQILAEEPLPDQLPQILVGRGDDAHVGADRRAPADRRVFALLEHAEEPRLRLHRHVADLVEEERAAFGLLEAAGGARLRAGEGAALVAEQLRFDQVARDRGHVDGDERALPPLAVIVQRARDELLAGAGLAGDHHGQVGLHEPREHAVDVLHRRRTADQRDGVARVLARALTARGPRGSASARPTIGVSSFRSNGLGR